MTVCRIFWICMLILPNWYFGQITKTDSIFAGKVIADTLTTSSNLPIITEKEVVEKIESSNSPRKITPAISPKKAGIYSALVPGLGQWKNGKKWKVPVIYAALGTGAGFIIYNQNQYKRYYNAFQAELAGQKHEFSNLNVGNLKNALGRQQDLLKRQRDYAIGITAIVYLLNIMDAVVDAHLFNLRNDPDLAIKTVIITPNDYRAEHTQSQMSLPIMGLSFQWKFK